MKRKPAAVSVTPGPIERFLSASEVEAHIERWMVSFGTDGTGIHIEQFLWHVFSYKRFPSTSRSEAVAQYEQHVAAEFVVISNDREAGLITKKRPIACSWQDWLVFPSNLAWTMAFTHEDEWLGPYFAKSTMFESLDAENRKAVRKASEAEQARSKGWG
ncbi:MAG: DUF4275 family protein [Gammaproteobacteria bacterium]|nr:MAG: DUF4275 family protein [Gammaproteobacteria bacterium]